MLMIRLQRVGRKNHAEFRVVVTEKTRAAKSSNYKELVGHYNPHTNEATFNVERIKHWIGAGAQVSDTLHNLLVKEGVIKGEKINVLPKKSPIVKDEKEVKEEKKEEINKESENTSEDAVKEAAQVAKDAPMEEEEKPKEEEKETPNTEETKEEKTKE